MARNTITPGSHATTMGFLDEKIIARAVKLGDLEADARKGLTRIKREHEGDNLIFALHYEGYITDGQAEKMHDYKRRTGSLVA